MVVGIFFISIHIFTISLDIQGDASSDSIDQSKEINAFRNEYAVDSMSDNLSVELEKNKINISQSKIWIEQVWHTRPKYFIFQPIQFIDKYQLVTLNLSNLRLSPEYIKKENYINYYIKKDMIYFDSIPSCIYIKLYLLPSDTANFIGTVKYKKIG